MRRKRPFFKQKLVLYFDENVPVSVVRSFRDGQWKNKVKVTSAAAEGNLGKSDEFHYQHCQRRNYTLVTLDLDFDDDRRFPFTYGRMAGIIMIRGSSSNERQIVSNLSRLLWFLTNIHFPKAFIAETKFVAAQQGVIVRGRDAATSAIKTFHVKAGATKLGEILEHFSYYGTE